MAFIADQSKDYAKWDFILGNTKISIARDRFSLLQELNWGTSLKISLRDEETDNWTKWKDFPGPLLQREYRKYGMMTAGLTAAIDVHRSILPNEIVIESDYPTYQENYEAARIVGQMIESKGFVPHYYYSGNKSVHIHVYVDWISMYILSPELRKKFFDIFGKDTALFQKKFILWIREKMITCWGTNVRNFDKQFINPVHLIRCELSRNKLGYKTFLGYSYKDLSHIPYICNECNRIYPQAGKIVLSRLQDANEIMGEFANDLIITAQIKRVKRTLGNGKNWNLINSPEGIRNCVRAIMSNDFKKYNDGFQRAMFIIINEAMRCFGIEQAKVIVNDWNERMGNPIKQRDIDYRLTKKPYILPCSYVHSFLNEFGIIFSDKCEHKV